MLRRHRGDEIRVDDAAFHQVDRAVVEVIAEPVVIEEMTRAGQARLPQDVLPADTLMGEVVDGIADTLTGHAEVPVDLVQQHRHGRRLPVVAVDHLGPLAGLPHELQGRLGQEREPGRIIRRAVQVAPAEELVRAVRVDEEALPAVHEPEPHRAVHGPAVPGHPQVLIGDREPEDLVVVHAVVFRQDDLDGVAAQLQLPAQPEDDLPQPARLRRRRTLRRNHHHEHGCLTVPLTCRAVRLAGQGRCLARAMHAPGRGHPAATWPGASTRVRRPCAADRVPPPARSATGSGPRHRRTCGDPRRLAAARNRPAPGARWRARRPAAAPVRRTRPPRTRHGTARRWWRRRALSP